MGTSFEQLREYVFGLEIIDTHEHLPAREEWRDQRCDVLGEYLVHYMNCDLVSAGLPREQLAEVTDPDRPLPQRWRMVEPFWTAARCTFQRSRIRRIRRWRATCWRMKATTMGVSMFCKCIRQAIATRWQAGERLTQPITLRRS